MTFRCTLSGRRPDSTDPGRRLRARVLATACLTLALASFAALTPPLAARDLDVAERQVRPGAAAVAIGGELPVDEPPEVEQASFFRLQAFKRADFNVDDVVDLSDAISLLSWLFTGGPPTTCENAGDANSDRQLDISDASYLLSWLFTGGPIPAAPGPTVCGVDRSPDALSCDAYAPCPDELPLVYHALNRITFGPTEELLTRIQTKDDLVAYIEEQLDGIDLYDQPLHEPTLTETREALEIGYRGQFRSGAGQTIRIKSLLINDAVESDWQLLHVLTVFWNNHFHTQLEALRQNFFSRGGRGGAAQRATAAHFAEADSDSSGGISETEWNVFRDVHPGAILWTRFRARYRTDGQITAEEFQQQNNIGYWKYAGGNDQRAIAAEMELREYDFFRRNAFGSFRDLLEGCSKSVAQMIYLNTFENTVLRPNENFPREFFELFGLGVDHMYTQRDIEEISKIFTGWTAAWCQRRAFDADDILFIGNPTAVPFRINLREPEPSRFATTAFWDDAVYTWGFHFGNPVRGSVDGHDWSRKDIFLPQYGGVDSLGNPVDPRASIRIAENNDNRTAAAALAEFDQLLETTVSFRDCAKYISSKLIQLFVTDDLGLLAKTAEAPADLRALFESVDGDSDGSLSKDEWAVATPDLPNGRPPEIFERLDVDGDEAITLLEYQEPDLLLDCIATWQATDGNQREVVRTILFSDEFLSLKFFRAKVKTPLENITSTLRGLGATYTPEQLGIATDDLRKAGMELYDFSDPTGESEVGFDWMHTVGLLERLKYVNRVGNPSSSGETRATWLPRDYLNNWGLASAEETIDFFTTLLLGGDILDAHRTLAQAEFDGGATREAKLRATVAYLLSLPEFQKQ